MLTKICYAHDDGTGTGIMPDAETAPSPIVGTPADAPTGDEDFQLPEEIAGEIEPPAEWDELEFEDAKIKAPKTHAQKVREALMRNEDYTKKTQEAASVRREYEAKAKALETQTEYDAKLNEGVFHLKAMDTELQKEYQYFQSPQYQQDQLDDFQKADARWKQYQMSLMTRQQHAGWLQSLANERNSKLAEAQQAAEAEASKRREQLPREIAKLVPGWNADMAAKVEEFAVRELGFEPDALKSSTEPRHFRALYLARLGHIGLQNRARAGTGAVQPKEVKPTTTVGQRGAPQIASQPKDSDDMDTWMVKERKREEAARKARQ